MKRLFVVLLITSLVTLTACSESVESDTEGMKVGKVKFGKHESNLIRDEETGCIYIYKENNQFSNGISPYYDETGKVAGCGEFLDYE